MNHPPDIDDLLLRIDALPPVDRVTVAHRILRKARISKLNPTPRDTLTEAVGLLRGVGPAPSDAEVKREMAEHRISKYGA